jgi:Fe-S oxidoreductase
LDAERLSKQTYLLSEFLEREGYDPPQIERKALVHGHCHQKSVLDFDAELKVLRKAGMQIDVPETGCCGMAGSFGFEADKYDVSMAAGERVLLPAVRQRAEGTLVVANGFSCREQVLQATKQKALHFAEVLALGLRGGSQRAAGHGNGAVHVPDAKQLATPSHTAEWRAPWKLDKEK